MAATNQPKTERLAALERANEIRTQRAAVKRDLAAGRTSIDVLLVDPPACVRSAKLYDLLIALPKYGRVKVSKVMLACGMRPHVRIDALSVTRRSELIAALRGYDDKLAHHRAVRLRRQALAARRAEWDDRGGSMVGSSG